MSITPSPVPRPEGPAAETTGAASAPAEGRSFSWGPWIVLACLMALGLGGLFLYTRRLEDRVAGIQAKLESALNSHGEQLEQLSGRLEQGDTRDTELRGQIDVAQDRLGKTQGELQRTRQAAAELAKQQKEQKDTAQQMVGQLGQLQQEQTVTKGTVGNLTTEVGGVRTEVKTTQEQLAATRSELQRVIGDLGVQSDLIAHNRGELEELKARGERDYVEFDVRKGGRQRVGNLFVELKKTDVKRQRYTLNLTADDRTIEKKDKTVFEPVQFYQEGLRQPTEVVVNQILKDRIVGYISAPKRKEARPPMKAAS